MCRMLFVFLLNLLSYFVFGKFVRSHVHVRHFFRISIFSLLYIFFYIFVLLVRPKSGPIFGPKAGPFRSSQAQQSARTRPTIAGQQPRPRQAQLPDTTQAQACWPALPFRTWAVPQACFFCSLPARQPRLRLSSFPARGPRQVSNGFGLLCLPA